MSVRPASTWADTRLIAAREIEEKLRSRAFVLSTLFFLLIVAASIALPALLFDDSPPEYDVATVGPAAESLVAAVPGDDVVLTARPVDDASAARRLLAREEVDAAVEVRPEGLRTTGLEEVPADLAEALSRTAQLTGLQSALTESGVPAEQVEQLLTPVPVQEQLLVDRGLDPGVVPLLSVAFGLLFFFVVYQFGYAISQGVVQEKESRVVELLVSAVPIRTLLYGKVLGNGGHAFGQILLIVLVALAGAALAGQSELLGLLARNSPWFLLFFVLGFAMLSCLWAAAGAFASRTEELQSTTGPLQLLVIVPFFAAIYVSEGPLRTALSFVPFSAPMLMPVRLLDGDAAPWEGAVAAALLLLATFVAVLVGERLYRASLLRTRGKTTLRQAWSDRGRAAS